MAPTGHTSLPSSRVSSHEFPNSQSTNYSQSPSDSDGSRRFHTKYSVVPERGLPNRHLNQNEPLSNDSELCGKFLRSFYIFHSHILIPIVLTLCDYRPS